MTPKQFVSQQLMLPKHTRVIPDRIYIQEMRSDDLQGLKSGCYPYNAGDSFIPTIFYENATYFNPNASGHYKYYPNGVFNV